MSEASARQAHRRSAAAAAADVVAVLRCSSRSSAAIVADGRSAPGPTRCTTGFGVTGINWPVFWAFYITNFVFWIGISHAGTLISAILRLVNAGWRRPVTRCAEVITAFALMIGAMFPIIHLGRPWLFFWLMPYPSERLIWPNFRSPLVWDFFAITTYLTGSVLFLFLPMIPDFALVRDRTTGLRGTDLRRAGARLAGHDRSSGTASRSAMQIMAIAIIPVAVSVHTIVSFDFSMAPVPMWHSTIFGPYFVAGAIFSGIAGADHRDGGAAQVPAPRGLPAPGPLPEPRQAAADDEPAVGLLRLRRAADDLVRQRAGRDGGVLASRRRGSFAPLYWTMVVCNFVLPFSILVDQEAADDHRLRDRVVRRRRRHVARALPDRRAVARPQVPAVQRGAPTGRGRSRS